MVRFEDCPVGLFEINGELCLKTEYGLEAYIVSSGECFWGGTDNTDDLRNVMVNPVEDVEPVQHGKWEHTHASESYFNECWRCSVCGFDDTEGFISNYCPNCGAKMMEE